MKESPTPDPFRFFPPGLVAGAILGVLAFVLACALTTLDLPFEHLRTGMNRVGFPWSFWVPRQTYVISPGFLVTEFVADLALFVAPGAIGGVMASAALRKWRGERPTKGTAVIQSQD